jgi:hypothetical protein
LKSKSYVSRIDALLAQRVLILTLARVKLSWRVGPKLKIQPQESPQFLTAMAATGAGFKVLSGGMEMFGETDSPAKKPQIPPPISR